MKAKKVLGFVLAGTMIAALAGCGSTGGTAKEKTDTDKKESSKESGEDINLTFWHIWPDAEMGEIVDSYVEKFEEEHPNVHIEAVATQQTEVCGSNRFPGGRICVLGRRICKELCGSRQCAAVR